MGTPLQDEANRRNGRLSRGRKTPGGKAVSAKNALKHGLLSREVLLPDEDAGAFAQLGRRLGEALDPVGELELVLAERIIALAWRLRRLGRIEAGILTWEKADIMMLRAEKGKHRARGEAIENGLARRGSKSRARLEGERSEKQQLEDAQETDLATRGVIFLRDAGGTNALSKLSRYETSMERSLYKTLHELQRLQAARQGKTVAPPLAVDIDVSGEGSRSIDVNVLDLPGSDAPTN
jgi:hypothetical protein